MILEKFSEFMSRGDAETERQFFFWIRMSAAQEALCLIFVSVHSIKSFRVNKEDSKSNIEGREKKTEKQTHFMMKKYY